MPYDSTHMRLPRVVKFMEKVEWWVPVAVRRGGESWFIAGTERHFGKMKKVLEVDGVNGWITV